MSRQPIARSPDLQRLQNEGYDLHIEGGYLLVRDVPYVTDRCAIGQGTLVVKLDLSGDLAAKPSDHVAYWIGQHPCHSNGAKITAIENPSAPQDFGNGLRVDCTFSAKADYRDYHHKVTTYIGRIAGEAAKLVPSATAKTFPAIPADEKESVFHYADTASSRAGITAINAKVAGQRIGIAGAGGTASYLLDLVAKTMVAEIHIFDGDVFLNHNAFRAPGAPSLDELRQKPKKVHYLSGVYSRMHRGLVLHDTYLDESNLHLLDGLDFVFVCMDSGSAKHAVITRLIANGTPFVEVGMGVVLTDGQLGGIVRVVCSTADTRDAAQPHISFSTDDAGVNEYASNIQVAELNAINAALAVLRWKQLFGIYQDTREACYRGYSIGSGEIVTAGAT